ncbi:MAG: NUDIX hydrolase [Cytophagaceae bacterium]|nr:NUDIX hydrolase [Cytophagaceae bacterium]
MQSTDWLFIAQRLQALAQAGLTYSQGGYDRERYEEIRVLSVRILSNLTDEPIEKIAPLFTAETNYPTPKVDVRAVIFRAADEVLMVQEKIDQNRWTLPGGWADVGYTPFEVAAKEVWEETGLVVRPVRLLAVFDKKRHPHPLQPWYVYKFFIRCEVTGGEILPETAETGGCRWVNRAEIQTLPLSLDRTTASQIETMFTFATNPAAPALCD